MNETKSLKTLGWIMLATTLFFGALSAIAIVFGTWGMIRVTLYYDPMLNELIRRSSVSLMPVMTFLWVGSTLGIWYLIGGTGPKGADDRREPPRPIPDPPPRPQGSIVSEDGECIIVCSGCGIRTMKFESVARAAIDCRNCGWHIGPFSKDDRCPSCREEE